MADSGRGTRRKRHPKGASHAGKGKEKLTKDQRRILQKARDQRRIAALEAAREEREKLDRRIAREQENPAMGAVAGAMWTAPKPDPPIEPPVVKRPPPTPAAGGSPPVQRHARELIFPGVPWEGDGDGGGAIGRARQLLRQGYNIRKVVTDTGVGMRWLDDIEVDRAGFGV